MSGPDISEHVIGTLCRLASCIKKGQADELDVLTHGIMSGQVGNAGDPPPGLSEENRDRWRRGYRIGSAAENPITANQPANPARQVARQPSSPRPWEIENDLIG